MTPSVLHAACFWSPYGGNFIASLKALSEACQRDGLRLVLVVPPQAEERPWCRQWADEGRSVYFAQPTPTVGTLRCAAALAKVAARENAVLYHTHFTQYDVSAWCASGWLGLRGRRSKVVWHVHSDFPKTQAASRRIKNWLKNRAMGRSANVIGVSDTVVQNFLADGFPRESLRIIPNGVDISRVTSPGRSRDEVAASLHLGKGERLVLLFGWHPTIKGVDLALDAVRQLADDGKKVVLAAVGAQEMADFIRQRVGETVPAWLRVLAPTDNVADLYQVADVFLSASRNEGFPYSVCEAMACGLPAVLSDIPGVAWAKQTPGAVFFPRGDGRALADSLSTVLDWTDEERHRSALANSQLVKSECDIGVWANRIVERYKEILA